MRDNSSDLESSSTEEDLVIPDSAEEDSLESIDMKY